MGRFSEETFNHWKRTASQTEETRISNAIRMVKDAVSSSNELKDKNIDIFVQGSYANDTNVRAESDVDVCVMLKDTFYSEKIKGFTREDYGFSEGANNFSDFRKNVHKALVSKYGNDNIKPGNKSIKIIPNSYRVETDAIPSFQYRNYRYINSKNPDLFKEGIKFYSLNNDEVINYPKIHIENGIQKNNDTQRRYKRLVRIFKRIRYKMIEEGISVNKDISSFLIECLVWNIPNSYFNNYDTWEERLREIIIYLFNQTKTDENCKKWREVSEMLYLFHDNKKWNIEMSNNFLKQVWNFLEFK
jgi:predicted nucleotidyltransferase